MLATWVDDMHMVEPLDTAEVIAAAQAGAIVTVEEHNVIDGLGGAVAEVLADSRLAVKFRRRGIADEYVLIGPPSELYAHYRLDGPSIAAVVAETCDLP
jgi:transketolase